MRKTKGSRYRGLKRLGPGRWEVRARYTDPATGRYREAVRRIEARTQAEAAAARDDLARSLRMGESPGTSLSSLEAYAFAWLERRAADLKPSTGARYADALAHLVLALGSRRIDRLTPGDLEDWLAAERRRGAAPATVAGWLRVSRSLLRDAARDLRISDPGAGVRSPRVGRTGGRRGTALSPAELGRLLVALEEQAALDDQLRASHEFRPLGRSGVPSDLARAIGVLAWTGLRRGELLALRWDDVQGRDVVVRRSVYRHAIGDTKGGYERRVVLPCPAAEMLSDQRRWLLERQHPGLGSGLCFPADPSHARSGAARRGAHVDWIRAGTALARALEVVVGAADLPAISLHSLRRTWEDCVRQAGVDGVVRRQLGGWRSEGVQAIYGTVAPGELEAAADAVERLIRGG